MPVVEIARSDNRRSENRGNRCRRERAGASKFPRGSETGGCFARRSNPALFTRCAILWMGEWKRASMRTVPTMMEGVRQLLAERGTDDADEDEDGGGAAAAAARPRVAAERKGGDGGEGKGGGARRGEGKGTRGEGKGGEGKRAPAVPTAPVARGERAAEGPVDDALLDAVGAMHESAAWASPREFVLFLRTWSMLHNEMHGGIATKLRRLAASFRTLRRARLPFDAPAAPTPPSPSHRRRCRERRGGRARPARRGLRTPPPPQYARGCANGRRETRQAPGRGAAQARQRKSYRRLAEQQR